MKTTKIARSPDGEKATLLRGDGGIELKEDLPGTFTGYASVFGKLDLQNDIVDAGAFARTLHHRGSKFKLLWQHNRETPIGTVEVEEDKRGLKVTKGEIFTGAAPTDYAYLMLKKGGVDSMSIGFRTVKDELDRNTGVRHLKEIDLWEVSLVTFPANERARVATVKSLDALSPAARALLEGVDHDEKKLHAAAAVVMGLGETELSEDETDFLRKYLEGCYAESGRAAPWAPLGSFDDLARHAADLAPFAGEARRDDLLRSITKAKSNPRARAPFDWLKCIDDGPVDQPFAWLEKMAPAAAGR